MPCSCCRKPNHNIRTCKVYQAKVAEAVVVEAGTSYVMDFFCGIVDAVAFGGVPVTTTCKELYELAEQCKELAEWSRMSSTEKKRVIMKHFAEQVGSF